MSERVEYSLDDRTLIEEGIALIEELAIEDTAGDELSNSIIKQGYYSLHFNNHSELLLPIDRVAFRIDDTGEPGARYRHITLFCGQINLLMFHLYSDQTDKGWEVALTAEDGAYFDAVKEEEALEIYRHFIASLRLAKAEDRLVKEVNE